MVGGRLRLVMVEGEREWSWSKELTAHFGNCSPGMRGGLCSVLVMVFLGGRGGGVGGFLSNDY